jgi:hypothetical protein
MADFAAQVLALERDARVAKEQARGLKRERTALVQERDRLKTQVRDLERRLERTQATADRVPTLVTEVKQLEVRARRAEVQAEAASKFADRAHEAAKKAAKKGGDPEEARRIAEQGRTDESDARWAALEAVGWRMVHAQPGGERGSYAGQPIDVRPWFTAKHDERDWDVSASSMDRLLARCELRERERAARKDTPSETVVRVRHQRGGTPPPEPALGPNEVVA